MAKYKVLKAFDQAIDCRTNISHAEGDLIDVPEGDAEAWANDGLIDEDTVEEVAEEKTVDQMTKKELLAYAKTTFDADLDGKLKNDELLAQIQELAA